MIFLFRISDLFLTLCLIIVVCVLTSNPSGVPFWGKLTMMLPFLLYVLWRFRRPVRWIIGALIFIAVFFYTLMAGLLGKHPEPEVEEE